MQALTANPRIFSHHGPCSAASANTATATTSRNVISHTTPTGVEDVRLLGTSEVRAGPQWPRRQGEQGRHAAHHQRQPATAVNPYGQPTLRSRPLATLSATAARHTARPATAKLRPRRLRRQRPATHG